MSDDSVLRRDRRGDADPEEKPRGDGGRDRRDTATSPGTPGAPRAGRVRKAPPWSLWRDTWTSDRHLASRMGVQ